MAGSKYLILAILAGYSLMGSQLINDNKALNRSLFFLTRLAIIEAFFAEELNTYDPITTNAGIFFDASMTSASDRRGLRTIAQKSGRFLFLGLRFGQFGLKALGVP